MRISGRLLRALFLVITCLAVPSAALAQGSTWATGLATSYGKTAIVTALALALAIAAVVVASPRL